MSVVPSEGTSQHSKDCELECNHVSHTDVTKKNRKSKKGNWRAGKHAIKRSKRGTLVDRGANGGILGNDANVVFKRSKTVDVTGIDNHELSSLRIVDATAKTITDKGPVILILRNYAYHGVNRTLHSAGQIEWYGNKVYDGSIKAGGRQVIRTAEGYYIPINIIRGLPYIPMEANTTKEFEELPHVVLTQGGEWDPTVLDHILTDDPDWVNKVKRDEDKEYKAPFDERGEYLHKQPANPGVILEDPAGPVNEDPNDIEVSFHCADATREVHEAYHSSCNLNVVYVYEGEGMPEKDKDDDDSDSDEEDLEANSPVETKTKPIDYSIYRPQFLHVSPEKIRRTFEATTQNAAHVVSGVKLQQTLKSPNPALNVRRRHEAVATDTIYADTPAVDTNGHTCAQIFVGRTSLLCDIYGMGSTNEFVNTLLDCIRDRGAMDKLISDHAEYETSSRVLDILRALIIGHWKSEPYYQHQNHAERRWGHVKGNLEWLMAFLDVDPDCWLLALRYVCDVMNLTAERSLHWRTPMEVATGQTPDISAVLYFMFWDVVYVARYVNDQPGSQKGQEVRGRFVGFASDCGHELTFLVLADDTRKILKRSKIRRAEVPENEVRLDQNNLRLDKAAGQGLKRKVNFKTTGRDPCLNDDFTMKTLEPNVDVVNDTSPRDDDSDSESIESEPKEPASIDDVDELPENADGEVDETPLDPEDRTQMYSHHGPRTKKDTFKGSHRRDRSPSPNRRRSPRLRDKISASLMYVLDPIKSRYNDMMEALQGSRSSTEKVEPDTEPILESEGEKNYRSSMSEPLLRDQHSKKWSDENQDDLAAHLKNRKPGSENPLNEPLKFNKKSLYTLNETVSDLKPTEMIGRTFLMPPAADGSRYRAKIMARARDLKDEAHKDPEYIKFTCRVNNDFEEVVAYNDIVDHIEKDCSWDGVWTFEKILTHKKVKPNDKDYRGSSTNCLVLWSSGEQTWEPLYNRDGKQGLWIDDPVTVAIYARDNGLLDEKGWKLPGLKKMAKTQKKLIRLANKAKLQSFRSKPIFMYGFQVPRNHVEAMELDRINGNTMWKDAETTELGQIDEYESFIDKGIGYKPGSDYKKIRVHMVYAVKHDGRHKARLVAGGHLTETPVDSVYSSVVSLRGIRILTFIAELNNMEVWSTDIGNAYLETLTKEKVYIIAGPEFGNREGHTLIIYKALYGLHSSGLRWSERLADVLRSMGFFPSMAERDIWMRDKGDHYEYIAVYVDDLLIASRDPKIIIDALVNEHCFKLKGTGPTEFHLGCDFFRDSDGVMCYAPKKYILKILDNYRRLFGTWPKQVAAPLTKNDHPELDTSELLNPDDQKIYQSMIGALQWVIQIGRFDITTAVMTLSRFRAMPRKGHMERVQRIYGYLSKMRHGVIKIRTEAPDYSSIPVKMYDWEYTCYADAKEEIPPGSPEPKGKPVTTTSYFDANLYHDLISGKSVTGVLHFFNGTPIDWYSKLQSTVETATFGSEYVAGRTCTEQIIDLRLTLRYLGVPINGRSMMFGDNESVINSAAIPHSKMHKRWVALSYHRVRYAVAARITAIYHVAGNLNPSDILSKHWDMPSVWKTIKPLLFWNENNGKISEGDNVKGNKLLETIAKGDEPLETLTQLVPEKGTVTTLPKKGNDT